MIKGFDYGNARVRAMRSRMLPGDIYEELLAAGTVERILGVLDATDYAPEVEATLTRYRGHERYDRALSANLARTLFAVGTFYDGSARAEVDLLLLHHDLNNLVTILRGQAALPGSAETAALLVPAGTLESAALEELARQPGLRETVELMATWGIPSPDTARSVLHRWPEYERTRDIDVLEATLAAAFANRVVEVIATLPENLVTMLESRIDATNVVTSLRLRRARLEGEPASRTTEPLAGGRIPSHILKAVITATVADAATALKATSLLPGWDAAVDAWAAHERIDILADAFDASRTRWAVSLFHRGDPLSIDIPLAYIAAKENEVRNLRLIGQGRAHDIAPVDIEARLVLT